MQPFDLPLPLAYCCRDRLLPLHDHKRALHQDMTSARTAPTSVSSTKRKLDGVDETRSGSGLPPSKVWEQADEEGDFLGGVDLRIARARYALIQEMHSYRSQ